MEALIRRGRESDMPALRDILNHYILNSVVTFEMVEMSLENRKTWFTQFTEDGRYQLFVAEKENEVVGYAASLRFHQRPAYAPSVMTSIYLHPDHTRTRYRWKNIRDLARRVEKSRRTSTGLTDWSCFRIRVRKNYTRDSAFRWLASSMRAVTNLVSITMSVCTNIAWGSDPLCDQRYC